MRTDLDKKNQRILLYILIALVTMIGVSFASVPLYKLFCQVTGFGGTPQRIKEIDGRILERKIKVRFNADTNPALDWKFKPEIIEMEMQIGQTALMNYRAENNSGAPIIGTAVYNVTPHKAGLYFGKIQCFCFEEQLLLPGQEIIMPVFFYIDPAIDDDPNLKGVDTITLSYTFYKARTNALDDALETYYETIENLENP